MQRRVEQRLRLSASSTMRPRYITATAMAMCSHHAEVVRDEQVGEPELVLQVHQQVQHLRLHRNVERRDRLVGDDERGLTDQRAGDADALALAAGEFDADSAASPRRAGRPAPAAAPRAASRSWRLWRCRNSPAARRR
jgi:hypothetical protein